MYENREKLFKKTIKPRFGRKNLLTSVLICHNKKSVIFFEKFQKTVIQEIDTLCFL